LCILNSTGHASTFVVGCADEAVALVTERVQALPAGIGVDAPLWWSSGRSGDRKADQWLRSKYGLSGGQVQAANSLRGAALVQAIMFIQRIRDRFGKMEVTECHPKAVLKALRIDGEAFWKRYSVKADVGSEHERDAVISAVAAREGFQGRWTLDLSQDRHPSEQDPSRYWLAPVHYFWPDH
jgi:predicted nuclease with RNAse H fold